MTYTASDPRVLVHSNLTDLIADYSAEHETTQNEFARRAGLSASCLSNYISGARYPRPEHLRAICTVLGVPISALFTEVQGGVA